MLKLMIVDDNTQVLVISEMLQVDTSGGKSPENLCCETGRFEACVSLLRNALAFLEHHPNYQQQRAQAGGGGPNG